MEDIEFTIHAKEALVERNISEEWVWSVLQSSDRHEIGKDTNMHYFKSIAAYDGRILHVVVNVNVKPNRVVTVFFDRRFRRKV